MTQSPRISPFSAIDRKTRNSTKLHKDHRLFGLPKKFFFAFLNPKSESVCKRLEMDINQMSRRQRRRGRGRGREREVTLTIQCK